jgi:hypothetical protein
MTRNQIEKIPVKSIIITDIQVGDHLRSAWSFAIITSVKVRAKTTLVTYKSSYDGYTDENSKFQFKNDEVIRIKS